MACPTLLFTELYELTFEMAGPYEVTRSPQRRGGLRIMDEDVEAFWEKVHGELPGLGRRRGVYVFGMKYRSLNPYYVGRTHRQTFAKEIFAVRNIVLYNQLVARQRGKPFVFLLYERRAARNRTRQLEDMLIRYVLKRNPKAENYMGRGKSPVTMDLKAILNDGNNHSVQAFRKMMLLK